MGHPEQHFLSGKVMHTPLGLLDRRLARLITRCGDAEALRRFACACAGTALAACGMGNDERLAGAVAVAALLTSGAGEVAAERARAEVAPLVAQLDSAAVAAQDAYDEGAGPKDDYERAYARAKAAASALECLRPDVREAAIYACYEAYYATGDAERLLALARETLA